MAKRGLGKGLDSLIPSNVMESTKSQTSSKEKSEEGAVIVKISMVEPNREQPRKNFDEDSLQELADSIKQFGLLQPILVQDKKSYYEIIAGERRWRAAKIAGLKEVPVIIRNLTDQEVVEISLIENIQREDLNPIEEAQAYKRLLTEFHLKQDEVAGIQKQNSGDQFHASSETLRSGTENGRGWNDQHGTCAGAARDRRSGTAVFDCAESIR